MTRYDPMKKDIADKAFESFIKAMSERGDTEMARLNVQADFRFIKVDDYSANVSVYQNGKGWRYFSVKITEHLS